MAAATDHITAAGTPMAGAYRHDYGASDALGAHPVPVLDGLSADKAGGIDPMEVGGHAVPVVKVPVTSGTTAALHALPIPNTRRTTTEAASVGSSNPDWEAMRPGMVQPEVRGHLKLPRHLPQLSTMMTSISGLCECLQMAATNKSASVARLCFVMRLLATAAW